jgi:pyridoxal 5'-phosphate synthase pdxS subunit
MSQGNGVANGHGADSVIGSFKVKAGLAQMLKGGVIMDVVNAEQVSHSIKSWSCCR